MLHKSWITDIEIYSDAWKKFRLGKFTSSKIVELMAEKEMSAGALSYIDQKIGEYVTGQNIAQEDDEVEDENTVWGLQYEPEALKGFAQIMGIRFLVTQKVIHKPGTKCSTTPDGLHIISSAVTQEDSYNVATVEAKCPRKYPRFMELYRCKTPLDLYKVSKRYFFQVIDQMDNCGAPIGYFTAFHPLYPAGRNQRIIEFKKIDLWDHFKKLQQRKELAGRRFDELLTEFTV